MQNDSLVTTQHGNVCLSAVRGYHVNQDEWKPSIRENLLPNNPMDKHAMKVVLGN